MKRSCNNHIRVGYWTSNLSNPFQLLKEISFRRYNNKSESREPNNNMLCHKICLLMTMHYNSNMCEPSSHNLINEFDKLLIQDFLLIFSIVYFFVNVKSNKRNEMGY